MEQINNSVEVLNIVRSIVHHLNKVNLGNMTQKIIALQINNVKLLEEIADIIHDRALKRQNYTHIYADMCASMINSSKFNKLTTNTEFTFQKVLLNKCSDVFYTLTKDQQELNTLKQKMKNNSKELEKFIKTLNFYQFEFSKKVVSNCRFISELYRKGAFPEKILLACITDLSNENGEFQMHCLCIILQLTGPILSKAYDLNKLVNALLLFMDNYNISSTLKLLILKVQEMHSEGWINEQPIDFVGKNYRQFSELPTQMKNMYTIKSYNMMSVWIFDECYDILFNFVNSKKIDEVIHLLKMNNIWIRYNPITFVVSMILVALEENQNIRNYAGKLLDNLVKKKMLSNYSIQSGVEKVLNDPGTKKEYPNLSNLVLDITDQFKL
ncbi:uncharacterized protein LOC132921556 [Rhopalosiphum padi]|uniref:uncharacterized protein LOC132921556 n=1 Tax=Rhopalosiphum padi TaxID=40932 RepID=UPI00298E6AAA|nr:uncharacterized protein LOC132921556 [Rhopalosiphum padi]XP_060840616.1 uncharacterized protein LOC132921556 [Rhopalosiphum padi]